MFPAQEPLTQLQGNILSSICSLLESSTESSKSPKFCLLICRRLLSSHIFGEWNESVFICQFDDKEQIFPSDILRIMVGL